MPFPRASQALSRFTVLDLTRVRSGPTCVRQLADWGANVIKIDALLSRRQQVSRSGGSIILIASSMSGSSARTGNTTVDAQTV
jgi:crotonobetainyl-CoA:carnitine CoA-transferase CaiB-like acyl-CoA transferase